MLSTTLLSRDTCVKSHTKYLFPKTQDETKAFRFLKLGAKDLGMNTMHLPQHAALIQKSDKKTGLRGPESTLGERYASTRTERHRQSRKQQQHKPAQRMPTERRLSLLIGQELKRSQHGSRQNT